MNMPASQAQRRQRHVKLALLGGAILVVVLLVAFALHRSSKGQRQAANTHRGFAQFTGPQPVQDAAVAQGDMPVTLSALGTVTPLATVTVRTQISGRLMQIAFREGQMVKAGDFLAEVDPRPYEVALEQAQGQLAKDQGLLDQAKGDLKRYQILASQDSISAQQLDDQQYLVEQYEGSTKSDQAQVDNAKLNLTYCHITAPVSGRVGLRQTDVGNYVTAADASGIVVITELSPVSVLFTLPEDQVSQVLQRLGSGARLPVTLYDRTNTQEIALGELTAVDNMVNTSTGTVQLRALFKNTDDKLFPNEFVNVVLLVDTLKGALIVPVSAVQHGVPGTYVYVVGSDDTVALRTVTLGPVDGERVAVTAGLKTGEQVVTDGAEQLKDGAKVILPQASTAAATAAPGAATAAKHPWKKGAGHKRGQASAGS